MLIRRNIMHMFVGSVVLLIFLLLNKWPTVTVLAFIFFAGIIAHMMIKRRYKLPYLETILNIFETEDEKENWRGLGAQTLILGFLLTIFAFPRDIAIPAILVLTFADAISAIAGGGIKSTVILESRTVFGSLAFFITAFIILNFFFSLPIAIIVAIIATLAELIPLPDDNLWIPLAVGLSLLLFLPFL